MFGQEGHECGRQIEFAEVYHTFLFCGRNGSDSGEGYCKVVGYGGVGAGKVVNRNVVSGVDKVKNVAVVVGGEVYVLYAEADQYFV